MKSLVRHRGLSLILLACVVIFQSCIGTSSDGPGSTEVNLLFIGHPYKRLSSDNKLDPKIEQLDHSRYDYLILGGDLLPYGVRNAGDLEYLDSTLNISSPTTLWALGNHDYDLKKSPSVISSFTGRPENFSFKQGRTLFLIMNSAIASRHCERIEDRLIAFDEACAAARTETSNFFIISHHAMWAEIAPKSLAEPILNAYQPHQSFDCTGTGKFSKTFLSKLQQLEDDGVDVYWISGDAGTHPGKTLHWTSPQGIDLIACGIGNSYYRNHSNRDTPDREQDKLLEISIKGKEIEWQFTPLDSLINSHQ